MNDPKINELPLNYTLRYMVAHNIPLTVENYVGLNFMGDYGSLDELEGEYRAEVERMVEDGLLVDTKSERVN